jgi:hypothetical protein
MWQAPDLRKCYEFGKVDYLGALGSPCYKPMNSPSYKVEDWRRESSPPLRIGMMNFERERKREQDMDCREKIKKTNQYLDKV